MKIPDPVREGDPVLPEQIEELRRLVLSLVPVPSPSVGVARTPGGTAYEARVGTRFPARFTGASGGLYQWVRVVRRDGAWIDSPGWSGVARELNGSEQATPFIDEVWLDPASRLWFFQLDSCVEPEPEPDPDPDPEPPPPDPGHGPEDP